MTPVKTLPDSAFMCQRWTTLSKDQEVLAAVTLHQMANSTHTKCGIRTNRGTRKVPHLIPVSEVLDVDWRGNIGRTASYMFMCKKCTPLKAKEMSDDV